MTEPTVSNNQAAAVAKPEEKVVELPSIGRGTSSFDPAQLPDLPKLQSLALGRSLLERLKPEQQKLAEGFAQRQDLDDELAISAIGTPQQEDSRKVIKLTGKLIRDDARIMDLGEVGKLADELKAKMVELGVGNLEEKWYHKAVRMIPVVGTKVDRLGAFLARFDKIGTRLEEILKAMTDEKESMEGLYTKAGEMFKFNKAAVENLTIAAASVEIMLKKSEEQYRKEIEKYKGMKALDDEDIDQIKDMIRNLSSLDRKLLTLKIQRVETRNSMRTMRDLMDAMLEAKGMLDDQITLQESIWRNQINNAILEHKIRGVNSMIKGSRDFTNRLIQQNQTNVSSTIQQLKQMAGEPGVDIGILKAAIEAQKQLREQMLEATVQNRKKLHQAAAQMDELDKSMAEEGKDLPTLERMLSEEDGELTMKEAA